MRRASSVALVAALCACAGPSTARQGGADFRQVKAEAPAVSLEALFGVCWPQDALGGAQVTLSWLEAGDVVFEVGEGATNATARCLRELASSVPGAMPPSRRLEVHPPRQPLDGWAVLAWVKLLAPSRFGPERGLLDPAPLVTACLQRGALSPGTAFVVRPESSTVRVIPDAVSDTHRCLEAVLGAVAWPSSRELYLAFPTAPPGPAAPAAEALPYFGPASTTGQPLDPTVVKDSLRLLQPKIAGCWNAALARRPLLGGARTFRFQVADAGRVLRSWVGASVGDGPVAADLLLDRCLASALEDAHFPPVAGDGLYTWVFATR